MAKVGIVTFHNAHNFGAVLQSFALQKVLKELCHDVEILNYSCDIIARGYTDGSIEMNNTSLKHLIKSIIIHVIKGKRKKRRFVKFNDFINHNLELSEKIESKDDYNYSGYDSIIFGSDQIWNINLTGNDTFYFGDFGYNGNRISYAASAGKGQAGLADYFSLLSKFKYLGVREQSLNDYLSKNGFKNCRNNVDPTLLLSSEKWIDLLHLEKKETKQYVLVYPLRERKETVRAASDLAKRMGLDLIEIGAQVLFKRKRNRKEEIDPHEFIELIYNSKYIVTNSFHGTVFAIIFNKDFNTIALNDGEDGRVKNLLKMLKLDDRILDIGKQIPVKSINYSETNNIINDIRMGSIDYLTRAIDGTLPA